MNSKDIIFKLVLASLLGIIIFMYIGLIYYPKYKDINELKKLESKLEMEDKEKKLLEQKYEKLIYESEIINNEIEKISSVKSITDGGKILKDFGEISNKFNLNLSKLTPRNTDQEENFFETSYKIENQGDYLDLIKFVDYVEKYNPYYRINNISIYPISAEIKGSILDDNFNKWITNQYSKGRLSLLENLDNYNNLKNSELQISFLYTIMDLQGSRNNNIEGTDESLDDEVQLIDELFLGRDNPFKYSNEYEKMMNELKNSILEIEEQNPKENQEIINFNSDTINNQNLDSFTHVEPKVIEDVSEVVSEMSEKYEIEKSLLFALIEQVSNYNNDKISDSRLGKRVGITQIENSRLLSKDNEMDLSINIESACKYLSELFQKENNIDYVLNVYWFGEDYVNNLKATTNNMESDFSKSVKSKIDKYKGI